MANYSGFLSNFIGTNNSADILSSVSNQQNTDISGTEENATWRYFVLGELLIQFSDGIINNLSNGSTRTVTYAVSYDNKPYLVLLTPTNNGDTSKNCFVTFKSFSKSDFTFYLPSHYDDGAVTFLVIGPRPSGY